MPWPPRSCRRRALVPTGQHTVWRPRIGLSGHGTPSGRRARAGVAVRRRASGRRGRRRVGPVPSRRRRWRWRRPRAQRRRPKCRSPAAVRGAAGDRRRFETAGLRVSLLWRARLDFGPGAVGLVGVAESWCRDVGHGNLPGFVSWRPREGGCCAWCAVVLRRRCDLRHLPDRGGRSGRGCNSAATGDERVLLVAR